VNVDVSSVIVSSTVTTSVLRCELNHLVVVRCADALDCVSLC